MQKPNPQKLTEALAAKFASPTRSSRLTVVVGRWLGVSFTICFLTGLFSHGLQNPPSWMFFPTSPVWIYQLTQGLHVTAGIASIPDLTSFQSPARSAARTFHWCPSTDSGAAAPAWCQ